MSLPYRWHASGTHSTREPQAGMLWPYEHVVYRIIDVEPVPETDWTDEERRRVNGYLPQYRAEYAPKRIIVRPVHINTGDVRDRDHDRHLRIGARSMGLDVYDDEHYPICAQCHEPLPCRDQMAQRVSTEAMAHMSRYEMAGVCPACEEPVTGRQKSQTWPDNAVIPQGPPVTFHLRRQCHYEAVRYEKQWVALDPDRRRTLLSCGGMVTNHNDGTYQCTQLTECPGPTAEHRSYTVCRCPDCHANGGFDCRPSPTSRNLAFDRPETGE